MTFVAPNLACGEARGGRIPGHGAVTDEQRSHRPNSAQPGGRQVFFAQTSLLAPHRSTVGYARRSRLVWAKNPLPRTPSYLCLRPLRWQTLAGTLHELLKPAFHHRQALAEARESCITKPFLHDPERFAVAGSQLCAARRRVPGQQIIR